MVTLYFLSYCVIECSSISFSKVPLECLIEFPRDPTLHMKLAEVSVLKSFKDSLTVYMYVLKSNGKEQILLSYL